MVESWNEWDKTRKPEICENNENTASQYEAALYSLVKHGKSDDTFWIYNHINYNEPYVGTKKTIQDIYK